VLTNLIDNSLRYVGTAGVVTFTSREQEGGIELSVRDNGSGSPRSPAPDLRAFLPADTSRSRERVAPARPSIVKHLVEAHGGRASAESELGVGTVIRVWFPETG
jgi:signal transduction histidine kinase